MRVPVFSRSARGVASECAAWGECFRRLRCAALRCSSPPAAPARRPPLLLKKHIVSAPSGAGARLDSRPDAGRMSSAGICDYCKRFGTAARNPPSRVSGGDKENNHRDRQGEQVSAVSRSRGRPASASGRDGIVLDLPRSARLLSAYVIDCPPLSACRRGVRAGISIGCPSAHQPVSRWRANARPARLPHAHAHALRIHCNPPHTL